MAGTNTPANSQVMRMMRRMSSSGLGGGGHTSAPNASVKPSSGGNPIGKAFDSSGDVDSPYMPYSGHFIGDSIAHSINVGIAEKNEAKHHAASEATQAKIQAGIDSYTKALQSTGNPQTALLQTFGGDGHVHFDPDVFNAVSALHKGVGAGGVQNGGQFQTQDLGNGLVGIASPDGKFKVMPVHEARAAAEHQAKMQKGPGGQYGTFDPQTNDFKPATVGGEQQQVPPGKTLQTTKPQMDQLSDIQTVLDNVQKMKNSIGATGSLGYGSIERRLAISSGFGGQQAEAYNAAYNDMAPALVRLTRVPGQSKMVAELAMQKLPKPGQATAFNIDQALPNIEYSMRQQVAGLYQTYKAENRVGGAQIAKQIAQTYDAHPALMQQLDVAKQALRTNPGQMTPDQVAVLQHEAENGRLSYDDWTRTQRQRIQRGLVDPKTYDKYVAASPELAQISPEEHTDPKYLRSFSPPQQQGAQPIPGGQAGPQPQPQPAMQQGPAPQPQPSAPQPQQPQQPPAPEQSPQGLSLQQRLEQSQALSPQQPPQQPPQGAPPGPQSQAQPTAGDQQPVQASGQANLGPLAQGAAALYHEAGGAFASLHSKLDQVLGMLGAGADQGPDQGTMAGDPQVQQLKSDIDKAAETGPDPKNQELIAQARKSAAATDVPTPAEDE